jgi:hypothetical protein
MSRVEWKRDNQNRKNLYRFELMRGDQSIKRNLWPPIEELKVD